MEIAHSENSELKTAAELPFSLLAFSYLFIFILISFILVLSHILNIPVEQFTADPAVTFEAHPFTGIGSHISVMMWWAAAVICFFASLLLKRRKEENPARFLLWSGIVSSVLFTDDLFMFHEAVFPRYFHIPQYAVYAGYFLLIAGFLFYFRKQILQSEYPLLIIALFFFGCSVAGDFKLPQEGNAYLLEDGLKMAGIVTWLIYFSRLAFVKVLRSIKIHGDVS